MKAELAPDVLLDKSPHELAELLDLEFDCAGFETFGLSRRSLCNYLGIAESTLSGWINQNRVPRPAKLAMMLLTVVESLRSVESSRKDLKVLEDGDRWLVASFDSDADGLEGGRVIARDVPTYQDALLLASARKSLQLLDETETTIAYALEMSENEVFLGKVKNIESDIDEHAERARDVGIWRAKHGRRAKQAEARRRDEEVAQTMDNLFGRDAISSDRTTGRQRSSGDAEDQSER